MCDHGPLDGTDIEEISDGKLIEAAINGMLTSLDPHSSYLNPENFKDMQVTTKGEFGGLGIEVTMDNGFIKVVSPIDDTPASKAGVKPGDVITHLDGDPVLGMTLQEAVDKMRGPVDTQIKLTIARQGAEKPFDLTLTRAVIKIQSVKSKVENDVGYIRITSFNEQTETGLETAISDSRRRKATSSKVTFWICATTRAGCSIRRCPSPTRSSTKAKSSRPGAASRKWLSDSTPRAAI